MISWHKSLDRNYTLAGRFDQAEVSSAFKLTIWQRRALEHRKWLSRWVWRESGVCSTWCFWLFCYKCQGRQAQLGLLVCAHKSHPASLCTRTGVLSSCRTGRANKWICRHQLWCLNSYCTCASLHINQTHALLSHSSRTTGHAAAHQSEYSTKTQQDD